MLEFWILSVIPTAEARMTDRLLHAWLISDEGDGPAFLADMPMLDASAERDGCALENTAVRVTRVQARLGLRASPEHPRGFFERPAFTALSVYRPAARRAASPPRSSASRSCLWTRLQVAGDHQRTCSSLQLRQGGCDSACLGRTRLARSRLRGRPLSRNDGRDNKRCSRRSWGKPWRFAADLGVVQT